MPSCRSFPTYSSACGYGKKNYIGIQLIAKISSEKKQHNYTTYLNVLSQRPIFNSNTAVTWLEYCRYGVKPQTINQFKYS